MSFYDSHFFLADGKGERREPAPPGSSIRANVYRHNVGFTGAMSARLTVLPKSHYSLLYSFPRPFLLIPISDLGTINSK